MSRLACLLLLLASCGELGAYQAPRLTMLGARDVLFEAVVEHVAELEWTVLGVDAAAGRLEAETPVEILAGVETRQHWTFAVEDGAVTAHLELEVRFDPSVEVWTSVDRVCPGYGYLRERMQLDAIAARAGLGVALP